MVLLVRAYPTRLSVSLSHRSSNRTTLRFCLPLVRDALCLLATMAFAEHNVPLSNGLIGFTFWYSTFHLRICLIGDWSKWLIAPYSSIYNNGQQYNGLVRPVLKSSASSSPCMCCWYASYCQVCWQWGGCSITCLVLAREYRLRPPHLHVGLCIPSLTFDSTICCCRTNWNVDTMYESETNIFTDIFTDHCINSTSGHLLLLMQIPWSWRRVC
jgi:hypothetical protein